MTLCVNMIIILCHQIPKRGLALLFCVTVCEYDYDTMSSDTKKDLIVARPFLCIARGAWSGHETVILHVCRLLNYFVI